MNQNDKATLSQLLRNMYLLMPSRSDFSISNLVVDGYFQALEDIELAKINMAITTIIQTDQFFPTPARIRELAHPNSILPSPEEMALVAWRKVSGALHIAQKKSVAFDDWRIHFAISSIDAFNSWKKGRELYDKALNGDSYDQHQFSQWRKNFFQLFEFACRHSQRGLPYPKYLCGEQEEVYLFGNHEHIQQVMDGGYPAKAEDFAFIRMDSNGEFVATTQALEAERAKKEREYRNQITTELHQTISNYFFSKSPDPTDYSSREYDVWRIIGRNSIDYRTLGIFEKAYHKKDVASIHAFYRSWLDNCGFTDVEYDFASELAPLIFKTMREIKEGTLGSLDKPKEGLQQLDVQKLLETLKFNNTGE